MDVYWVFDCLLFYKQGGEIMKEPIDILKYCNQILDMCKDMENKLDGETMFYISKLGELSDEFDRIKKKEQIVLSELSILSAKISEKLTTL
jgi:hypothetical protein